MQHQIRDYGRRLLREPLAHFLIAGAIVFWLMSGRAPDVGERRIVVDEAVAGRLVQRWNDTFHRPPSAEEFDSLIGEYVKDQVYYREALRLGLDQEDEIVVRRMRRKLEDSAAAEAEAAQPDEAVLQAMLDKDPARYALEPRITFDQIYLGADTRQLRAQAPGLLDRLRAGNAPNPVPAPLPAHMDAADTDAISRTFGDELALAVRNQAIGTWQGPVASGLGLHFIRVTKREAARKPSLAEVRQRVENDWRAEAIRSAQARGYAAMLEGYDVEIELKK